MKCGGSPEDNQVRNPIRRTMFANESRFDDSIPQIMADVIGPEGVRGSDLDCKFFGPAWVRGRIWIMNFPGLRGCGGRICIVFSFCVVGILILAHIFHISVRSVLVETYFPEFFTVRILVFFSFHLPRLSLPLSMGFQWR